jgi:N-acetyl-1-D-myo-inositol-2-amino-2-deoxy-alpha-D-glucopyranoside deacetylase/mycothiol S-conjugate amidase
VGTVDPIYLKGFRSIAELRESELRCAAHQLRLKSVAFLGYRDSGMAGSPHNEHPDALTRQTVIEVAGRIVRHIRELKPSVVLTFDPLGVYRHPDHIHVHNATTLAFEKAGDPSFLQDVGAPFAPQALYYHVVSPRILKIAVRLMPLLGVDPTRSGRNRNIDLTQIAAADFPVHVRVNTRTVSRLRDAARACHVSQGGSQFGRGVFGLLLKIFGQKDQFMRAFPKVPDNAKVQGDFFEIAQG